MPKIFSNLFDSIMKELTGAVKIDIIIATAMLSSIAPSFFKGSINNYDEVIIAFALVLAVIFIGLKNRIMYRLVFLAVMLFFSEKNGWINLESLWNKAGGKALLSIIIVLFGIYVIAMGFSKRK